MAKALAEIFNGLVTHGFELFGRYYSSYRGYVVDNEDPKGYGRLKLMIPQITGSDIIDYWAWPKHCFSGKDYGMQITPQKNDMVWVEFEFGSPRKPIWSFGHFGQTKDGQFEKPVNLKDIKNFWFKTPGGHLVEFDDTNKWVKVTGSKGGSFILDDKFKILAGSSPAVLGDKNSDILNDLKDVVDKFAALLVKIQTQDTPAVSALASATGVTLTYPDVISTDITAIQTIISGMQTKINNNNSQKVTLE